LVQDLLGRMVKVEAKAKKADEKRTDIEARVKILELEMEKMKEELGSEGDAGLGKEAKIHELIEKIAKMEGETESRKQEMPEKVKKVKELKTDGFIHDHVDRF
jgi:F0F1-type ATP synthase beta subunit